MIHNRNTQAALLLTVIGITVIAGWLVVASLLFGGTTNIASEIAKNGVAPRTADAAVGTTIPLIPDVTLTITGIGWSRSLAYSRVVVIRSDVGTRSGRVSPLNPDFRLLAVDYEIVNGSDEQISRDGLAALFHVIGDDGEMIGGMDLETYSVKHEFAYGASSDERLLKLLCTMTYNGTWFFEMNSLDPNLRLVSELIELDMLLPVDDSRDS